MQQIYIAGPLFTPHERHLLEQIDKVCGDCGFVTYLPHRDGGLYSRDGDSHSFFVNDLLALDNSDIVVAVLNGCDVDSGTSWEMGYAFSKGKIIIGYIDDIRIFESDKQLNLMITNSLTKLTNNSSNLRDALTSITL